MSLIEPIHARINLSKGLYHSGSVDRLQGKNETEGLQACEVAMRRKKGVKPWLRQLACLAVWRTHAARGGKGSRAPAPGNL
jgi:hypothetical protein